LVTGHVLCVRLDNAGDVLLCGPAVRATAAAADRVTMLVAPQGEAAARLLPGVDAVEVWRSPWIDAHPPPVAEAGIDELVARLRRLAIDEALIFTSFHQSPLPTALLLRLAGVARVSAISTDYPGSLLDVRHRVDEDLPEPERALSLAVAAGFGLPEGDDGRLAVSRPLPEVGALVGDEPYVVLHPGTSVPARAWGENRCREAVLALSADGWRVVVTGGRGDCELTAAVAGNEAVDLGGRTDLRTTAAVLAGAQATVVGNTGPAHLSAAVATPVVSLFAPTVPAVRWAPYGVRHVLLGDQDAPCRDTRVTTCVVPGHPCLSSVTADDVVSAVRELVVRP
jgi:ADP-heptose:LPS heptosyltransferase